MLPHTPRYSSSAVAELHFSHIQAILVSSSSVLRGCRGLGREGLTVRRRLRCLLCGAWALPGRSRVPSASRLDWSHLARLMHSAGTDLLLFLSHPRLRRLERLGSICTACPQLATPTTFVDPPWCSAHHCSLRRAQPPSPQYPGFHPFPSTALLQQPEGHVRVHGSHPCSAQNPLHSA